MFTETLILFTALASFLWYYFVDPPPPKGKKLPGPFSLPFLGSALQIALFQKNRNYEIFEDLALKYGPVLGFRAGFNQFVIISDFELGKEIMASDDWSARTPPQKFITERSFNKNLGLIFSHGESWKEARRYTVRMLRQFGFGKTKTMETFIEEELLTFLEELNKKRAAGADLVPMHNIFSLPILNLTWSLMAGIRFSYDDVRFREFLESIEVMQKAIRPGASALHAFPFLRFIPGFTEHDITVQVHLRMQEMFREIIEERRKIGTYIDEPKDFIDVFMQDVRKRSSMKGGGENYITEEQLIMVCIDLFFTSSDTTSAALEFAMLYMTLNPEVARKVKHEIDTVLGGRMPNLEDREKMTYIEATMLEALRYSSINPIAGRSPSKDTYINGYFIPKNAAVAVLLHGNHFSEKVWGDPVTFRPERFLGPNNKIINAEKITPFGYGKRVCIGESLARASFFIFFTVLMQRYDLERSPNPDHRLTTEPRSGLTSTPEPYHILLKTRQTSD